MSRHVAALVYAKRVGSMARKSILAYCAERANDDGSGVWASKVRIAKEVECSKQTVIETIRGFVAEGILSESGRRKTPHGYVVEYRINVALVVALPTAIEDLYSVDDQSSSLTGPILDRSTELTPRGQATGPQEVKLLDPNRPLTVLKPSLRKHECSDDLFSGEDTAREVSAKPQGKNCEEAFERFYKAYPLKKERRGALLKFQQAVKSGIDPEKIIEAAKLYAEWLGNSGPRDFRPAPKMPTTWLNKGCWDDELEASSPRGGPSGVHRRSEPWGEVVR